MQEFDQLKTDINELISAATETITALVDQAARDAQAHAEALAAATAPAAEAVEGAPAEMLAYTSQILQLSIDVRAATDKLRHQASLALGVPAEPAPEAPAEAPATSSAELLPTVDPVEGEAPAEFKAGA